MRVWYLSAYDQPEGHSSRTFWYASELSKRGHQVTMFTNSYCHFTHIERFPSVKRWKIEHVDDVRVVWLKTIAYVDNGWKRAVNMLQNAYRALQFAKSTNEVPDVVIGPSVPILTGWAASRIATIKKAAFIFEVRDIWPQALVDLKTISPKGPYYLFFRAIEKYLYKKATKISAVLPLTYKHVEKSGSPPNKVVWIPNGVNLNSFKGLESYNGGVNNILTAMYIGGFSTTHDVDTILKAVKILKEDYSCQYHFIIVGEGKRKEECKNFAKSLELDNIDFYPTVPKKEVPSLQSKADVLIASVKDTPVYQFGINSNKLYDYLGSGRPIIFSGNAPDNPVVESGAGLVTPPEDPASMAEALWKIYNLTSEQRIEMGQRGRLYAEKKFDLTKLVNRMENMLFDATKGRSS